MESALREMANALRRGDETAATLAFARFGEAMLTNPFTLQAGFKLAGDGLPVDYVVEGSEFFRSVSLFRTVGDSGQLAPDHRSPLFSPRNGRGGAEEADSFRISAFESPVSLF